MSAPNSSRILAIAVLVLGFTSSPASAGWLTVKNEMKVAVLLQDVPDSPTAKRGKPVRLLPGEVYREYHAAAGEKQLQILDAKSPTTVLCDVKVKWPVEDVTLRVRTVGTETKLEPAAGKPAAVVTPVAKKP